MSEHATTSQSGADDDRSRVQIAASPMQIAPCGHVAEQPLPTTIEESLRRLWGEILAVDAIKADDDFFDLGGTSLAVVMLLTAIEEQLGLAIELEELFLATTLDEHVAVLQAARAAAGPAS